MIRTKRNCKELLEGKVNHRIHIINRHSAIDLIQIELTTL